MDDKKIGVFFLIGVFLILGVYFVGAAFNWATLTGTMTQQSIHGQTTLTKGGESNIFNFTITNTGGHNITSINITMPRNYTISNVEIILNGSSIGSSASNWTFMNYSNAIGYYFVWNNTYPNNIGRKFNDTYMNVWINATTISSGEEITNAQWAVTINQSKPGISILNTTYINFSIDTLSPRVTQVNISDGNTTYINGTNLDRNHHFGVDSPLVIRTTVNETNLQNVWLYYLTNNTNVSIIKGGENIGTKITMTTSDTISPYMYSGTIPASALTNSNGNLTFFAFYVNDTIDNWYILNGSVGNSGFNVNITSNILKIGALNATDGIYIKSDSNLRAGSRFLGADRLLTFAVEITGEEQHNVTLYYNSTDETIINAGSPFNLSMNNFTAKNGTTGMIIYNTSIQAGIYNNTAKLRFLVVAEDTKGYKTYTRFNFTIDGASPTIGAPTASSSSVSVGTAVTLTCAAASDADSSLTYSLYLDTPGSSGYEQHSGSSYVTGTDETDSAGTYNFYCTVTDSTGHSATSATSSFSVTATTSSSSSSSSGGGGSGGSTATSSATEVTEISQGETENLGTLTQTIANNIIAGVDSVATFTMATSSSPSTASSHSLTINEITTNSVTLTIESDPIEVTLEIGDVETVDVDVDGTDDLEIVLNDITDGEANLTMNTLVASVTPTAPTTEPTTQPTAPVTGGEKAKTSTGLWIVLIIVIVGLVLWFLFRKKK